MTTKRRFAAAILAALILAAVTASLFIVAHESHHNCVGENCRVCSVIAVCQNTLKTISGGLAAFAATAASVCFAVILVTAYNASLRGETPISLKVKLLD
ncbi:MAG: hypothetical protein IJU75_07685 [Clostridia bacterium]|nr:hypothetical protein [Clostridia bacterium]